MSIQNYTSIQIRGTTVKVMNAVVDYLSSRGFALFIDHRADYAAYGYRLKCSEHGLQGGCECEPVFSKVGFVHELTDKLFHPGRPLGKDQVVHHKVNRFDNRIKNLARLKRSQHATHHNRTRQRHTYRQRFRSAGLYRPHQPGQVVHRPDLKDRPAPGLRPKRPPTFPQRLEELERRLAAMFPTLYEELRHLDSGKPIPRGSPRSRWREAATRRLGLRMPRLQCTPAEGTVVLASIKVEDDEDMPAAIAAELKTEREFVVAIWQRPSVSVARQRWVSHRRLPSVGRKQVRD